MREIKFRAWDKHKRKMYKWGSGVISIDHQLNVETVPYPRTLKAADIELMQYIGLKDRKGVEIYEGDIVRVNGGDLEFASQIIFARGAFRVKDVYDQGFPHKEDMEVIGNIYEHTALLKEAKP